jgi:hypothetical protein
MGTSNLFRTGLLCLLSASADFLLGLFFDPEDADMFLQNIG